METHTQHRRSPHINQIAERTAWRSSTTQHAPTQRSFSKRSLRSSRVQVTLTFQTILGSRTTTTARPTLASPHTASASRSRPISAILAPFASPIIETTAPSRSVKQPVCNRSTITLSFTATKQINSAMSETPSRPLSPKRLQHISVAFCATPDNEPIRHRLTCRALRNNEGREESRQQGDRDRSPAAISRIQNYGLAKRRQGVWPPRFRIP